MRTSAASLFSDESLLHVLVESAGGRPIYVTSGSDLAPRQSDRIIDGLARQYGAADLINARRRYQNGDWQRGWRREHESYGAAIVLTAPAGDIGVTVLRELADMVERRRPILWLPERGQPMPCFAVDPLRRPSPERIARLREEVTAGPFRPLLSRDFFAEDGRPAGS